MKTESSKKHSWGFLPLFIRYCQHLLPVLVELVIRLLLKAAWEYKNCQYTSRKKLAGLTPSPSSPTSTASKETLVSVRGWNGCKIKSGSGLGTRLGWNEGYMEAMTYLTSPLLSTTKG